MFEDINELTVEAGNSIGSFSFKHGNDYLDLPSASNDFDKYPNSKLRMRVATAAYSAEKELETISSGADELSARREEFRNRTGEINLELVTLAKDCEACGKV